MAFLEKMRGYLDKGVEVSKDALSKAGDAVQDFSDKSLLKIEIRQLSFRQAKAYRTLGQEVYRFLQENPQEALAADNGLVSSIIQEIQRLGKEIERRKAALEGKDNGASSPQAASPSSDDGDGAGVQFEADPPVDEADAPQTVAAGRPDATDVEFSKSE